MPLAAPRANRNDMLTRLEALTLTPPAKPLVGRVTPPGSKSITNRALLLAALAHGTSRIAGALKSKDTALMELVGHPRPVNPRPGLAAAAARNGWPVLRVAGSGRARRGLLRRRLRV